MADTKALFTQRFDAARAALSAGDEPAAAESLHWAIVAARTDPNLRRELASALFHLGKLSRKFGRAGETEADQLLTEALAISESLFGADHVALAPLLSELSRLHVQRAQYSRADEVLERLLAITRAKGEETADVAVALAGLAVVKRKLGEEASAEALYRDALHIREKVLEPNHMVTVATMEQLSETCAALGNFAEALTLLQRALPARELALGPGHATVKAVRTRIAELELQVAIAADTAAVAAARAARGPIPTPVWIKGTPQSPAAPPQAAAPRAAEVPTIKPSPTHPEDLEFLGEPEPKVVRPAPRPRERSKTPAVTAAVAAASLMASPLKTPSASHLAISPHESTPSASVTGPESGTSRFEAVLADLANHDVASADASLGDAALGDAALADHESSVALVQADSPEPAPRKRAMWYASAGVAAAVIAAAALLMLRPRAGGGKEPVSTQTGAAQSSTGAAAPVMTAAATNAGSIAAGAAAVMGAKHADSLRPTNGTHAPNAPNAPAVRAEQRAQESAPSEFRAPVVQVNVGSVNVPSIPTANIDSIVRSATERPRASDTNRIGAEAGHPLPTPVDADEAVTPPKIIGRAPVPRFPDELLHSPKPDGEVVVRFKVNELGRADVASMIVVRSDHDLFTAAVRDILPLYRFEPARTRDSRPAAVWVSVPFRFTAKKK